MTGGNLDDKGYCYTIRGFYPRFIRREVTNIHTRKHKYTEISLPTKILLTSNNSHVIVELRILGLGMGIEIQTRS